MHWTSCALQESSSGSKLSIVGSDSAICGLRPRARDHLAGKIATASISNKAPGRASSGTPIVVLAGGADMFEAGTDGSQSRFEVLEGELDLFAGVGAHLAQPVHAELTSKIDDSAGPRDFDNMAVAWRLGDSVWIGETKVVRHVCVSSQLMAEKSDYDAPINSKISLCKCGLAQAGEKAFAIRRAAEGPDQPWIRQGQLWKQAYELCETGLRLRHLPQLCRGRSEDAVRIRKCRIEFDRLFGAGHCVSETLRVQMRPGVNSMPNHHQVVARAQAFGVLECRDRAIWLAPETQGNAKLAARQARVWIELDCAHESLDGVVVAVREHLIDCKRSLSSSIAIFRGDCPPCRVTALFHGLGNGFCRPAKHTAEVPVK